MERPKHEKRGGNKKGLARKQSILKPRLRMKSPIQMNFQRLHSTPHKVGINLAMTSLLQSTNKKDHLKSNLH